MPLVLHSRAFVKYWLPVLLWMAVIYSASTDLFSSANTSNVIGPVLRYFFPTITMEAILSVQLAVRKGAHMTEYGILAWLLWRALRKPEAGDGRPWSWVEARHALLLAVLYAATDELHQSFTNSREGCVRDVCIDASGATLGLIMWWHRGQQRKLW